MPLKMKLSILKINFRFSGMNFWIDVRITVFQPGF